MVKEYNIWEREHPCLICNMLVISEYSTWILATKCRLNPKVFSVCHRYSGSTQSKDFSWSMEIKLVPIPNETDLQNIPNESDLIWLFFGSQVITAYSSAVAVLYTNCHEIPPIDLHQPLTKKIYKTQLAVHQCQLLFHLPGSWEKYTVHSKTAQPPTLH